MECVLLIPYHEVAAPVCGTEKDAGGDVVCPGSATAEAAPVPVAADAARYFFALQEYRSAPWRVSPVHESSSKRGAGTSDLCFC